MFVFPSFEITPLLYKGVTHKHFRKVRKSNDSRNSLSGKVQRL